MNTPFDITREEVLNLAAQKLADSFASESDLYDKAHSLVEERVSEIVSKGLTEKVDAVLSKEMEGILSKEIIPVDIWGEKAAEPTTIRAQLHERAKTFWEVSIDEQGRPSHYGGEPRHQRLMEKILKDEFAKAIKSNSEEVISAFKKALKEHTSKLVAEHIDSLIRIK